MTTARYTLWLLPCGTVMDRPCQYARPVDGAVRLARGITAVTRNRLRRLFVPRIDGGHTVLEALAGPAAPALRDRKTFLAMAWRYQRACQNLMDGKPAWKPGTEPAAVFPMPRRAAPENRSAA